MCGRRWTYIAGGGADTGYCCWNGGTGLRLGLGLGLRCALERIDDDLYLIVRVVWF